MDTQQQNEKEFISLVETYQRLIYKVCYIYATDADNLNDLYQEVVINLWRGFPTFRFERKPSTWIYWVALNTCISFFRKNTHNIEFVPLTTDIEQISNDDSLLLRVKELYQMINKLGKLEKALVLLYLEDKSYQEIADITKLTYSNVATKLSRIKEKLRKMSNN